MKPLTQRPVTPLRLNHAEPCIKCGKPNFRLRPTCSPCEKDYMDVMAKVGK